MWFCCTGCPVAVANLWDVTDRDIDRFSQAVLAKWLREDTCFEEVSARSSHNDGHGVCVSMSVTNSRNACRLSSLIGAAPVCYGIPVAVIEALVASASAVHSHTVRR